MKIKRLYAENLYSYKKMEMKFEFPGGTTLILGKNLDQPGTSNGAGKTSILKALYFALYGEDMYKATLEQVVNDDSSTGYYVELDFEDRGYEYKIRRFHNRKDKSSLGKKNDLEFYIDNDLFKGDGGIDETQSIILQKIRVSPNLFLSSVLSAQNAEKDKIFLLTNDSKKKELLSELLDLQVYQKAFDFIKKEKSALEDRIKEKENVVENLSSQIAAFLTQIEELTVNQKTFDLDFEKNKLYLLESIDSKNVKIDEMKQTLKTDLELEVLEEEKKNINKNISQISGKLAIEDKLNEALSTANGSISALNTLVEENQEKVRSLQQKLSLMKKVDFDPKSKAKLSEELSSLEEKQTKTQESIKAIQSLRNNIEKNNLNIDNLQEKIASLEKEAEELRLGKSCPSCERPFDSSHTAHIEKQVASILSDVKKLNIEKTKLQTLNEELEKESLKSNQLEAELSEIKKEKKSLFDKEKSLISLEQEFNNFENNQKEIKKDIDEAEQEVARRQERKDKLLSKQKEIQERILSLTPLKEELVSHESNLKEINEKIIFIKLEIENQKKTQERITELELELSKDKESLKDLEEKGNPYSKIIERVSQNISVLEERVKKASESIDSYNDEMRYLNFWHVGFAPTGIRSFITDDVIELLNRKVQENLNDLSDGVLSVVFDPESKNNKGVVSNKISTDVFRNGKKTALELLSGGEKKRAILATDLALTEIAESRAGTKFNVRFLDEPMENIDTHGQIQSFKLFSRLSREKDGFFIISHNEHFQNLCSNVVYVVKKGGVSKIVSKSEFQNAGTITSNENRDVPLKSSDEGKSKQDILAEKLSKLRNKNQD